jgi:pimeloyl-ACP methyl ester carboxylesterase
LSVLDVEDLEDAVPVGHSYAGIVISAVADRRGERLGTVVWLDSSPVRTGCPVVDALSPEQRARQHVTFASADTVGAGRSSTAEQWCRDGDSVRLPDRGPRREGRGRHAVHER